MRLLRKLAIVALIVFFGWQAYKEYQAHQLSPFGLQDYVPAPASQALQPQPAASAGSYRCDGRTHCSQMTSCEEATFFLKNCPDVKMDGNNAGSPCEQQWCR